jgi:hypothetical protein
LEIPLVFYLNEHPSTGEGAPIGVSDASAYGFCGPGSGGSVKNFCQQVQTSDHFNTFNKTAIFTSPLIAAGICPIIKTLFTEENGRVLHLATYKKVTSSGLREAGQIPPEVTYPPRASLLAEKVHQVDPIPGTA